MNLNNLQNEIRQVPHDEPVFIYVGIGTAAGLLNSAGRLEPENYHQFPPFLQDLRNTIPRLNLFLVLIDPQQENPPYLMRDYPFIENQPDHFILPEQQMQVFVYRENVYTNPYLPDGENDIPGVLNITNLLRDLNDFAIKNRASLLYHDFTGRRNASLAEYFETECPNLDQIVYGLSAREDHGCYFDLTKPSAYFATRIESPVGERPVVKMFNYYQFTAQQQAQQAQAQQAQAQQAQQAQEERRKYSPAMQPLIKVQRNQIAELIINNFKEYYLAILRQLQKNILHNEQVQALQVPTVQSYLFNIFPKPSRNIYLDLLEQKEYGLLKEIIFDFCVDKLNFFVYLKKLDISGEEMLKFITADADPYKWHNNIKLFI